MKKIFFIVCFLFSLQAYSAPLNCKIVYSTVTKDIPASEIVAVSATEIGNCPDKLVLNLNIPSGIKNGKIVHNLEASIDNGALCVYSSPKIVENDAFATIRCTK